MWWLLWHCFVVGVVFGEGYGGYGGCGGCGGCGGANNLPFQCPHKVPKDSLQPSKNTTIGPDGGGLCPSLWLDGDLDFETNDFYAQYRAALALVPCDGKAISVFTEDQIEGSDHTVSVIYVYDRPVEELKTWLKEKVYSHACENPLVEAIAKQCPELAYELANPNAKPLTGSEILNILCEGDCTRESPEPPKDECAKPMCAIADCSKPGAADLCPDECAIVPVTPASPEVYTPGPIYYKPHTPPLYTTNHKYKRSADQPQTVYNYPYNYNPGGSHETAYAPVQSYASPVIPAVLTTNHQSYVSPNQQPTYTPSCEYVNFDDAPEPIYGIAISTRTVYDCNDAEYADLCTKLQKEDKFVDCDNRRFSQCNSEWTDCIPDTEDYLRTKTKLYQGCEPLIGSDTSNKFANLSTNQCFENRQCLNGQSPDDDRAYAGYDPDANCECKKTKSTPLPTYYSNTATRYKRGKPRPKRASGASQTSTVQKPNEQSGDSRAVRPTRESGGSSRRTSRSLYAEPRSKAKLLCVRLENHIVQNDHEEATRIAKETPTPCIPGNPLYLK